MSIISYPTPLYQNPAIDSSVFTPQHFQISAVSLGETTTVTTSSNHDYVIGQLVRLLIPVGYGCRQLNNQLGYVISLPASNQVELQLNSVGADAFTNPGTGAGAQILAVGDYNSGEISSSGNTGLNVYIQGSFRNTSP